MSSRTPTGQALELFRSELRQDGHPLADLTLGHAWPAFLRFGHQHFDTPATPDSDGLLFQYGTHSFHGPPMFTVTLTRQFEVNDHNGEHDHFVQINCELRYQPNPALERLGSFNHWFFHDADEDLDHWAHALSPHLDPLPGWRPDGVHLVEERV